VLAEQEVKESGADPRLLLTLGEALRNLGQRLQAAQMFGHALHRSVAGGSEMLEAYYGVLTTLADGTTESLGRQVAICLEALEVFPLDAQLLAAMGGFLVQQGNLEIGVRSFETALMHGQVDPTVSHLTEIQAVAALCAAGALVSLGDQTKAKALLQQALQGNPQCEALQAKLAELESSNVAKPVIGSMHWNHAATSQPVT
jgi:tetratricopeptide (TPR) repeat protein